MALESTQESRDLFKAFDIEDLSTVAGTTLQAEIPSYLLELSPTFKVQFEITGGTATENNTILRYMESLSLSGLDDATAYSLVDYDFGVDGADAVKTFALPDDVLVIPYTQGNNVRLSLTVPGGATQGALVVYAGRVNEVSEFKAVLT